VERKTAAFTAGKISADDFQDNLDTIAEVTQSHRDAISTVGLRLLP
jgi:phage-related minor tail protein